jgi:hypothetical protein
MADSSTTIVSNSIRRPHALELRKEAKQSLNYIEHYQFVRNETINLLHNDSVQLW